MIILNRDVIKIIFLFTVIFILAFILAKTITYDATIIRMGGYIYQEKHELSAEATVFVSNIGKVEDRFQRPSKEKGIELKYTFKDIEIEDKEPFIAKGYPTKYESPEDVVHAYYSILKEASNMEGYQGGCGTIGWAKIPYRYAYGLLTDEAKKKMSLKKFEQSFKGTGHITLLKLLPAYNADAEKNQQHYFVEIEVITGAPYKKGEFMPSYFAYYYGIITTEFISDYGWKIQSANYIPQDFLCAPYHLWHWDRDELINIVYIGWYGIFDKIDKVEEEGSLTKVYASGKDGKYKLQFVRLTNGEDILLNEYILKNDIWEEVNLLKPEHQFYKMSMLKFNNDSKKNKS